MMMPLPEAIITDNTSFICGTVARPNVHHQRRRAAPFTVCCC